MIFQKLISALLLAALLGGPVTARAFNCNVSATSVNFGSYDVFSATPADSTGTISVSCNIPAQNPHAPLPVTISLSPGNSGSFGQRHLLPTGGGPDRLVYNLYVNPSYSAVWGNGGGGSQTLVNGVTRDTPWTATIFARIPPRQNVRVGSYSDLITVTVDW